MRADRIADAALPTKAFRVILDDDSGPTKSDRSITLPTAKYRIRSAQKSWSSCCGQITSSLSCQQKPRTCRSSRHGSKTIGISCLCFYLMAAPRVKYRQLLVFRYPKTACRRPLVSRLLFPGMCPLLIIGCSLKCVPRCCCCIYCSLKCIAIGQ